MSYISARRVKRKKYFYLEESFFFGSKLVKESVYLGPNAVSNEELLVAFDKLSKKCKVKKHKIFTPPLTDFISNRTAQILENSKKESKKRLDALNQKEKKAFFEEQKISFSKFSFALENTLFNTNSCLTNYNKALRNNEKISSEFITKLYSALMQTSQILNQAHALHPAKYREKEIETKEEGFSFPPVKQIPGMISLLINWFYEKENLIHPIELATKFKSKFVSIQPFEFGNELVGFLLMNYILQQKGFSFVNIKINRLEIYKKAQTAGNKEDYKPITKLIVKEIVKQKLRKHN